MQRDDAVAKSGTRIRVSLLQQQQEGVAWNWLNLYATAPQARDFRLDFITLPANRLAYIRLNPDAPQESLATSLCAICVFPLCEPPETLDAPNFFNAFAYLRGQHILDDSGRIGVAGAYARRVVDPQRPLDLSADTPRFCESEDGSVDILHTECALGIAMMAQAQPSPIINICPEANIKLEGEDAYLDFSRLPDAYFLALVFETGNVGALAYRMSKLQPPTAFAARTITALRRVELLGSTTHRIDVYAHPAPFGVVRRGGDADTHPLSNLRTPLALEMMYLVRIKNPHMPQPELPDHALTLATWFIQADKRDKLGSGVSSSSVRAMLYKILQQYRLPEFLGKATKAISRMTTDRPPDPYTNMLVYARVVCAIVAAALPFMPYDPADDASYMNLAREALVRDAAHTLKQLKSVHKTHATWENAYHTLLQSPALRELVARVRRAEALLLAELLLKGQSTDIRVRQNAGDSVLTQRYLLDSIAAEGADFFHTQFLASDDAYIGYSYTYFALGASGEPPALRYDMVRDAPAASRNEFAFFLLNLGTLSAGHDATVRAVYAGLGGDPLAFYELLLEPALLHRRLSDISWVRPTLTALEHDDYRALLGVFDPAGINTITHDAVLEESMDQRGFLYLLHIFALSSRYPDNGWSLLAYAIAMGAEHSQEEVAAAALEGGYNDHSDHLALLGYFERSGRFPELRADELRGNAQFLRAVALMTPKRVMGRFVDAESFSVASELRGLTQYVVPALEAPPDSAAARALGAGSVSRLPAFAVEAMRPMHLRLFCEYLHGDYVSRGWLSDLIGRCAFFYADDAELAWVLPTGHTMPPHHGDDVWFRVTWRTKFCLRAVAVVFGGGNPAGTRNFPPLREARAPLPYFTEVVNGVLRELLEAQDEEDDGGADDPFSGQRQEVIAELIRVGGDVQRVLAQIDADEGIGRRVRRRRREREREESPPFFPEDFPLGLDAAAAAAAASAVSAKCREFALSGPNMTPEQAEQIREFLQSAPAEIVAHIARTTLFSSLPLAASISHEWRRLALEAIRGCFPLVTRLAPSLRENVADEILDEDAAWAHQSWMLLRFVYGLHVVPSDEDTQYPDKAVYFLPRPLGTLSCDELTQPAFTRHIDFSLMYTEHAATTTLTVYSSLEGAPHHALSEIGFYNVDLEPDEDDVAQRDPHPRVDITRYETIGGEEVVPQPRSVFLVSNAVITMEYPAPVVTHVAADVTLASPANVAVTDDLVESLDNWLFFVPPQPDITDVPLYGEPESSEDN